MKYIIILIVGCLIGYTTGVKDTDAMMREYETTIECMVRERRDRELGLRE